MNASLIKELRDISGAGLMDCKKALEHSNGDIDGAIDYLREKGISKAAKKQDRIAAEGLSTVVVDGNNASIVEVNCETDFVAQNAKFVNYNSEYNTLQYWENNETKTNIDNGLIPLSDKEFNNLEERGIPIWLVNH